VVFCFGTTERKSHCILAHALTQRALLQIMSNRRRRLRYKACCLCQAFRRHPANGGFTRCSRIADVSLRWIPGDIIILELLPISVCVCWGSEVIPVRVTEIPGYSFVSCTSRKRMRPLGWRYFGHAVRLGKCCCETRLTGWTPSPSANVSVSFCGCPTQRRKCASVPPGAYRCAVISERSLGICQLIGLCTQSGEFH
jgi:hypothetical protein